MSQHRLSFASTGGTVNVSAGDELVIELVEQATAGYRWALGEAPQGVEVAFERPSMSPDAAVGAVATTIAKVKVNGVTGGRLVLRHRQPWDEESDATTFEIMLTPR